MRNGSSATLKREELYELVWTTPPPLLSKFLGISPQSIREICKKNSIPWPNAKEFKSISQGGTPKREPLPHSRKPLIGWITIHRNIPPEPVPESVKPLIAAELQPTSKVNPPDSTWVHPWIESTRAKLQSRNADSYGRIHAWGEAVLDSRVRRADIPRGLEVWSTILWAFHERGWEVQCSEKSSTTVVIVRGHPLEIRVEGPTGTFALSLHPDKRESTKADHVTVVIGPKFYEKRWRDEPEKPIEKNLNAFLARVLEIAERERLRALERQREDEEFEKRQRRHELEAAQREELEARIKDLHVRVAQWQTFKAELTFIAALKREVKRRRDGDPELREWLKWAEEQVQRDNPVGQALLADSSCRLSRSDRLKKVLDLRSPYSRTW